ncbi:MAG: sporulation protein YjcZ [Promethearchaeota archaeon]
MNYSTSFSLIIILFILR